MDALNTVFRRKKVNLSKLADFGFVRKDGSYHYRKVLAESDFLLNVQITEEGNILTSIIDPYTDEPYTLHLAESTVGSFVGKIKRQYEETLTEIAAKCFDPDVFKSEQAQKLIVYIRAKYGDELEFLWEKFPDNAIWRRKDNQKWYGALLTVSRRKLGLPSDEPAEILDLRLSPDKMHSLIDNSRYFPGWHMNKKSWYTVILDGSVPTEEIYRRIDVSYLLASEPEQAKSKRILGSSEQNNNAFVVEREK